MANGQCQFSFEYVISISFSQEVTCSSLLDTILSKTQNNAAIPNPLDWLKASDCCDHSLCAAQECAGVGYYHIILAARPSITLRYSPRYVSRLNAILLLVIVFNYQWQNEMDRPSNRSVANCGRWPMAIITNSSPLAPSRQLIECYLIIGYSTSSHSSTLHCKLQLFNIRKHFYIFDHISFKIQLFKQ